MIQALPDNVFLLMLLAHVLGDFYLQTDAMVKGKEKNGRWLAAHGIAYFACMALVMAVGVTPGYALAWLIAAAAAAHAGIDWLKRSVGTLFGKRLFVVDQTAHLLMLALIWVIWGRGLEPRWFLSVSMANLPMMPLPTLLGILLILRPVGLLIESGGIWDLSKLDVSQVEEDEKTHAGRMIGYIERVIVLLLLMYKQFGTIAFVLTAKSMARFEQINRRRITAEYYLIGTLLSVASALIVAIVLGLCG